ALAALLAGGLGCSSVSRHSPAEAPREPAFLPKKTEARLNDLCICISGATPESERSSFKLGCSVWLSRQSCELQRRGIEGESPTISEWLEEATSGSKVVVGFVGLWGEASRTVSWLETEILPAASRRGIDLRVDTSASMSGSHFQDLQRDTSEALKIHPVPNLEVRLAQMVSSGIWDSPVPMANPFWLEYAEKNNVGRVHFPRCRDFEGRSCWSAMPGGGGGFCEHSASGEKQLRLLVCGEVERESRGVKVFEWLLVDATPPFWEIRETKVYRAPSYRLGLKNNRLYDDWAEGIVSDEAQEEGYLRHLRQEFLDALPVQVQLDSGDESLERQATERTVYSLEDIQVKERRSGHSVSGHVLFFKTKDNQGKTVRRVFGVYRTRGEAEAIRSLLISRHRAEKKAKP
ncbi:MAG: hypothetical protein KGQ59_09885, partial [Bdellovibrionales bacterium]|nr:hypothetical protein [Bdellovibrionales bacterium]